MKVMKFGGSSLAEAARLGQVIKVVRESANEQRVGVVVSAVGGITNLLVQAIDDAIAGKSDDVLFKEIRQRHQALLDHPDNALSGQALQQWQQAEQSLLDELQRDLNGVRLLKTCPDEVRARILCKGEQLSSSLIAALLRQQGKHVLLQDPRELIRCNGDVLEALPDMFLLSKNGAELNRKTFDVVLMPGFFAGHDQHAVALLGRNGSDFSGALLAYALQAKSCEIWTDVDGVYTADPRLVANAKVLPNLSFEEALELCHFGAKVLHPKTIGPLAEFGIPILIRNTLKPEAAGTRIDRASVIPQAAARGLTLLDNVALITIAGPGLQGVPGVAARIFATVAREKVSIILITQASSEFSLSFAVPSKDSQRVLNALQQEFKLEQQSHLMRAFECDKDIAILTLVGDGLHHQKGLAGRFFSALAATRVNAIAIAQGSSERSLSVVISHKEQRRALRGIHQQFFESRQQVEVFLVGVGTVGKALLEQLQNQQPFLREHGIDLRLCGVANSKKMFMNSDGFAPEQAMSKLQQGQPVDLQALIANVSNDGYLNPVLVDCTSDAHVARTQLTALKAGLHVVTANKKANTLDMAFYHDLRTTADQQNRRYLYETNVGAALPVIDTLQNVVKSGDKLQRFSGILSGSLSYVFGLLDDGVKFSEAVQKAKAKGFTEPDPRDDLSGMDVARKLLILLRDSGSIAELSDINVENIFPADFDLNGNVSDFMQRLPEVDSYFAERIEKLKQHNKALRFAGVIEQGKARVGLIEVDREHPLYPIRDGENALAFYTRRYDPVPLVIRGYGAGADVTAGGVFADVLRTVSFHPARGML
ncbi:bifunctional aspartate kinase/homoserine dehydrogenase I [Permianibacter aggregans]|uniref:Bifunctional aspartokinase/homoserine dehydrogenase n=1 Tax=Permianibacter aggregans TaxID=1510150 RepID=A0A4R6UD24_9GAMM|nr:bifunctional aspartate kinase/homoserine dehydrogenase I [Permianibacter aggregans]QGX39060.1 bifunctional aspartate kinase/homoserine dehydrogenase I [Permianibacter aggregans]TDQ44600.1 aspartate kinase [Permianibacter aggregans]